MNNCEAFAADKKRFVGSLRKARALRNALAHNKTISAQSYATSVCPKGYGTLVSDDVIDPTHPISRERNGDCVDMR